MQPTILVIDDNTMVREVVQSMLNVAGYHALGAEDGSTALAVFAGESVDAAIIDVDMPDMSGVDVCRALTAQSRASGRQLLVWLMTGVVRPELPGDASAAGAAGVLAKPFTREQLLSCFRALPVTEHALAS